MQIINLSGVPVAARIVHLSDEAWETETCSKREIAPGETTTLISQISVGELEGEAVVKAMPATITLVLDEAPKGEGEFHLPASGYGKRLGSSKWPNIAVAIERQ